MQFIVKGGIYTKNSPQNTKDSILLGLRNNLIDGILLKVQMTKDKKLVIYSDNQFYNCFISNTSYNELLKYNLGSKIKKHTIILLEDVLNLYQGSMKKLILEVSGCYNNKELVEQLAFLLNKYPTINSYISSTQKEIIIYAQDLLMNSKVGANIIGTTSNLWDLNLDFSIINPNSLNISKVIKKLKENQLIMFENTTQSQINEISNDTNSIFKNQLFLIIDSISIIN